MAIEKSKKEFHIWEGIYKNFKEAPMVGSGFSGNTWNSRSLAKATRLIKLTEEKKAIPEFVAYRENLLPILTAMLPKKKPLKIIDFGGNLGQEYLAILHSTNLKPKDIKYIVVENGEVCAVGKKLFKGKDGIQFVSELPRASSVDIIHIGSTLQYIEDWRGLVKQFAQFTPSYILFTDLQAGDIPTFATSQNYYDSKMPVWYFNIREIVKEFKKLGFELLHRSTFRGSFLGKEQDRPMQNLPKKFRLKNACNLLFKKI